MCKTCGFFHTLLYHKNTKKSIVFDNYLKIIQEKFSTDFLLKSARDTHPETKAKNSLCPRGRAEATKVRPPQSRGRAGKKANKKRVGAGAATDERAKPERKILEMFLIVSRGGGEAWRIFPNMEKSAAKLQTKRHTYGKKCDETHKK